MRSSAKIFLVAALASGLWASATQAAGVLAAFGGSYHGGGRISDADGRSESLTCRSTNSPSSDGNALSLSFACASDSYKVDFNASLNAEGGDLSGSWSESSTGGSGQISGTVGPGLINATTSGGFSANIVVRARGGRLDVSLSAQGAKINRVVVSMRR